MLLAKACRKSPRLPAVAPDPPKLLTRFWKLCCKPVSEPLIEFGSVALMPVAEDAEVEAYNC